LRASGSGLPESVLQRFDEAFAAAMSSSSWGGSAKWRDKRSDASFDFYLTSEVVAEVLKCDWAKAASKTADGAKQVDVFGGSVTYNQRIGAVVRRLVERAIDACVGTHRGTDDWGWQVLAPSTSSSVAHRGKIDFAPHDIFYMATGSKKETAAKYKSAKRLLRPRWFSSPPAPFEGPYFR